jgi:RNA polymerase sigma factor (sigma-70 family)
VNDLESLVIQAQDGNPTAYGDLVRRFQDMAVGYAFSILGDFHLAEDASQEAFARAFTNLAQLGAPAAFPGWFRKIVFTCCDRLARRKQIPTVPLEVELVSSAPGPDAIAEAKETSESVHQAIRNLPDSERAVITLFYISGYSQKEVGAFLDIPAKTVKSRLHTARTKLRERMIEMVQNNLHENRPSNDDRLAHKVLLQRVNELFEERAEDVADLIRHLLTREPEMGERLGILMQVIASQTTTAVKEHLGSDEIDQIVDPKDQVEMAEANEVLEEFERLVIARKYVSIGGLDFARGALTKALGNRKAESLLNRSMSSSGFFRLRQLEPDRIIQLIATESPLNISIILAQLESTRAVSVFHGLPEKSREEVAVQISAVHKVDPLEIRDLDIRIARELD